MIGAIIQARMGSTRFPEKVLKPINDKTILEHIYRRVSESKVEKVIVATSTNELDDVLEEFCKKKSFTCYRGSENDVLERYYKTAEKFNLDIIVRVTADDPLKDTKVINKAIDLMLTNNYDYVSNTIKPTYPEGIDIEVFTFNALKKAYNEAKLLSEREHVTPYIWKNPQKFKCHNFEHESDLSHLRWTLDTEDDYEFMCRIYSYFDKRDNFDMEEVLKIIALHPEIIDINSGHIRNEGYLKSMRLEENK